MNSLNSFPPHIDPESIPLATDARIERVETYAVRLPTHRSFSIAGGTVTESNGFTTRVLVRVLSGGLEGWGEATPTPAWTYETAESIYTTIDRYLAPAIIGMPIWDLDGVTRVFDRVINRGSSIGSPLAKSAVDIAMHDLLGHALGLSIGQLWGQRRRDTIDLGWVISGNTPEEAIAAVDEGSALGYRHVKIKVGLADVSAELEIVRAVREHVPSVQLWVDGNQGFTLDTARRFAASLADLDIVAFEQPLRANDIAGSRALRESSPVPIALDESLRHPTDLVSFARFDALDIAIAKVQRNGGLTLSRRLCQTAEDFGLRLMGSGLTDTELGFAASLHLFAAFGIDTAVDLNGRQFVDATAYAGENSVLVRDGVAHVPSGPGLGVSVDAAEVAARSYNLFAS